MKWNQLPQRATVSMSKADVEKLRSGGASTFISGMVTGAVLLLFVQGCTTAEVTKPDKPVAPSSSPSVKN